MITIEELCLELRNWFCQYKTYGEFVIENGSINLSELVEKGILKDGQYIRIIGSTFNDGVYTYPSDNLEAEVFDGSVWLMTIPPYVISLVDEINEWLEKYEKIIESPYQSESFSGYSYSKGASGKVLTWQDQFKSKLSKWRKIA